MLPSPVVISNSGPPPLSLPRIREQLDGAVHRHRHVELDVSVAGMGVEFSGEILRQTRLHPAIAGMDHPARAHLRSGTHGQVNMSIAGAQIDVAQHTVNRYGAVASMCVQRAVEVPHLDVAVAGVEPRAS